MGIKIINIVSNKDTIEMVKRSLGDGNKLGLNLSYTIQEKASIPEGIILNKNRLENLTCSDAR